MPVIEASFEVYCKCGAAMCHAVDTKQGRFGNVDKIVIEPCEKCLEERYDEGYTEGHTEGYDDGYTDAQEGSG